MSDKSSGISYGAAFGCSLAMVISFSLNHSFWWAVLHGILGWFYLIYYGIFL